MAELPAALVTEVLRALAIHVQLPNLAEEIHARREQLAREGAQWNYGDTLSLTRIKAPLLAHGPPVL